MGMNIGNDISGGSQEPEVMMEINTTPLIDVMLVLLVMLVITIPIQLHSVDLNLPSGKPPPLMVEPEIVSIEIDAGGHVLWNGDALPDRAALEAKMGEGARRPTPPEIHLRPDRRVPYERVAAVLASAQRLGLKKIGIVGNEQYR